MAEQPSHTPIHSDTLAIHFQLVTAQPPENTEQSIGVWVKPKPPLYGQKPPLYKPKPLQKKTTETTANHGGFDKPPQ